MRSKRGRYKKAVQTIGTKDYLSVIRPDHHFADKRGQVMEHRLIWELYHCVSLLPWSVVHHKDGNKQNNDIRNLKAMMKSDHVSLHKKKDMSNRRCINCDSKTTYIFSDGRQHWHTHPLTYEKYLCHKCYRDIDDVIRGEKAHGKYTSIFITGKIN